MSIQINDIVAVIKAFAPNAKPNYQQAIEQGDALFQQHQINTPQRLAHFFAQALHETGNFSVLRENMNYSEERLLQIFGVGKHSAAITPAEAKTLAHNPEKIAERIYGLGNPKMANMLGNTQAGDGYLYRGNGVLQTTGRDNHKRMGIACGVDFENHPDLVTDPQHALKPALQKWTDDHLNTYADQNDITTITKKINGGSIGLPERKALFEKLLPAFNAKQAPDDNSMKWLQQSLNDLGANPKLTVDGLSGPATVQAVKIFQTQAHLTADGKAGPMTKAAIKQALADLGKGG
jgi:putative chitinase